jgi:hypothetical protein
MAVQFARPAVVVVGQHPTHAPFQVGLEAAGQGCPGGPCDVLDVGVGETERLEVQNFCSFSHQGSGLSDFSLNRASVSLGAKSIFIIFFFVSKIKDCI